MHVLFVTKPGEKPCSHQLSDRGFTIVESLMAIVVVGVLMTAIAPVISLSVSNRVQAKRVELATQAAKTYVDGIRSGAIAAPSDLVLLHEIDTTTTPKRFSPQRDILASFAAPPSSSFTCTSDTVGYPYCQHTSTSSLYCNDVDGGGCGMSSSKDLVIQAFRTSNIRNYLLGVRVYRADAFGDSSALKIHKQMGNKQATFTGGLGDRKAPLVEMATEISTEDQFRNYCDRLGGCQ